MHLSNQSLLVILVVGIVAGISQGAQRFFRGRRGNGASADTGREYGE